MFKNILVPTDGSITARKAAKRAIALAKRMGARVTAFHVVPAYKYVANYVPRGYEAPLAYAARIDKIARRHLHAIENMAKAAGVQCASYYVSSDLPADAILKAVKPHACDAIVMGTHGRAGLRRLFLGSQTIKVLAHARVPVIVIR